MSLEFILGLQFAEATDGLHCCYSVLTPTTMNNDIVNTITWLKSAPHLVWRTWLPICRWDSQWRPWTSCQTKLLNCGPETAHFFHREFNSTSTSHLLCLISIVLKLVFELHFFFFFKLTSYFFVLTLKGIHIYKAHGLCRPTRTPSHKLRNALLEYVNHCTTEPLLLVVSLITRIHCRGKHRLFDLSYFVCQMYFLLQLQMDLCTLSPYHVITIMRWWFFHQIPVTEIPRDLRQR